MSGRLLSDQEILASIQSGHLKVSEFNAAAIDLTKKSCAIQPSSLDLHVGEIFIPPKKKYNLSKLKTSEPKAVRGARIAPGHSAIVVTKEEIELDETIAAFGFPPAHLTASALLMTNPGHVDPGFKGKLSFTIINLGREDIQIDTEIIIVTLLIFQFESKDVAHDYMARQASVATTPLIEVRADTLNALSPDFGNYSSRLSEAALKAVEEQSIRLGWAKLWMPALTGGVTALVIWASSLIPSIDLLTNDKELEAAKSEIQAHLTVVSEEVDSLDQRIKDLEMEKNIFDFDEQLDSIREQIRQLQEDG